MLVTAGPGRRQACDRGYARTIDLVPGWGRMAIAGVGFSGS